MNVLLIAAGAKPRRGKVLVAGIIQVCRAQQPSQKRDKRKEKERHREKREKSDSSRQCMYTHNS